MGVLAVRVRLPLAVVAVAVEAVGSFVLFGLLGIGFVSTAAADGEVGKENGEQHEESAEKDYGCLVIKLFLLFLVRHFM